MMPVFKLCPYSMIHATACSSPRRWRRWRSGAPLLLSPLLLFLGQSLVQGVWPDCTYSKPPFGPLHIKILVKLCLKKTSLDSKLAGRGRLPCLGAGGGHGVSLSVSERRLFKAEYLAGWLAGGRASCRPLRATWLSPSLSLPGRAQGRCAAQAE